MSDRANFLHALLSSLPAQLEHATAGEAPASCPEFGAVCAAYLGGRCGRDAVLRAAASHMQRELPEDLLELVRSAG